MNEWMDGWMNSTTRIAIIIEVLPNNSIHSIKMKNERETGRKTDSTKVVSNVKKNHELQFLGKMVRIPFHHKYTRKNAEKHFPRTKMNIKSRWKNSKNLLKAICELENVHISGEKISSLRGNIKPNRSFTTTWMVEWKKIYYVSWIHFRYILLQGQ